MGSSNSRDSCFSACTKKEDVKNDKNIEKKTNSSQECVICMEAIDNNAVYLDCCHVFHKKCIRTWWNYSIYKSCPICREYIY